jgi:superfamily II DNA or RNA helicase
MGHHKRAMVIAHREELIRQAKAKILRVTGHDPDVEMAEYRAEEGFPAPIVVSSVQTQNAGRRGKRMERFDPHDFQLLIIDEAHHAPASSYQSVIEHYRQNPNLKVLGVTATPDRADEVALGQTFDNCAFDYELLDAIEDGWLVEPEQYLIKITGLDFSKCRTTAGDLNQGDLEKAVLAEKPLHGVADAILAEVGDRKTLVFAVSVDHAKKLAEILNRHREDRAFCIHAGTDREVRREELKRFKDGSYQFMVNVGIATEGFDEPSIQAVAVARATKSRCLYAQMIGRGTRPLEECVPYMDDCGPQGRRTIISTSEKPSLMVLDFVGNAGRHKLVCAADVLGGKMSEVVVARARRNITEGGAQKVTEALKQAQQQIEAEQARKLRLVRGKATYSRQKVNAFDVLDLKPVREREWSRGRQPSEKMLAFLKRCKVPNPEQLSFTEAGRLIGELKARWQTKRCTYAQAALLRRFGESIDVSVEDASATIDRIKANGWKPLRR